MQVVLAWELAVYLTPEAIGSLIDGGSYAYHQSSRPDCMTQVSRSIEDKGGNLIFTTYNSSDR